MVQEVMAYKTGDGKLHSSPKQAATHEARTQLTKCLTNIGYVNDVMNHARCVYEALGLLKDAGLFHEGVAAEEQPRG